MSIPDFFMDEEDIDKIIAFLMRVWPGLTKQDYEDIATGTFLQVEKYRHTFDQSKCKSRHNWLCTIALRILYKFVGAKAYIKLESSLASDIDESSNFSDNRPDDSTKTADEIAINQEEFHDLRECLSKLPKQMRNVVNAWGLGNTYAEISEMFDITVGTARLTYSNAKKKLEKCLRSKGYEC